MVMVIKVSRYENRRPETGRLTILITDKSNVTPPCSGKADTKRTRSGYTFMLQLLELFLISIVPEHSEKMLIPHEYLLSEMTL